jgi:predicted MFS family arabinose efflux permease
MVHGVIQVRVMELSETARAAATSLHSFFFFLGQAAGPALFGLGLVTVGATITLIACAVLMLLVGIVCARGLGREARET